MRPLPHWLRRSPAARRPVRRRPPARPALEQLEPRNLLTAVIHFDNLAPGTLVSGQYHNQGIDFVPILGQLPAIAQVSTVEAQSGDRVADITHSQPGPAVQGTFTALRQHVRVFVGEFGSSFGSDTDTLTLTALDSFSTPVAQATATVTAGAGVHTLLAVDSASANIASFRITDSSPGKPIGMDDLAFDDAGPPQPDFYLTPQYATVRVIQGGTSLDPITVARLDGSTGQLQFSASGQPFGIAATFAPNPSGGVSVLRLTAGAGAPLTGLYPATLTVTGTPQQPTAGPSSHSLQMGVQVVEPFRVQVEPSQVEIDHCVNTPTTALVTVYRDPAFTGTVDLSATGVPPEISATFNPTSLSFTLNGPPSDASLLTLRLNDPNGDDANIPSQFIVTIHARSGQVDKTTHLLVRYEHAEVNSVTPTEGLAPQDLNPGTTVVIHGVGFCPGPDRRHPAPGFKVQFGNQLARGGPSTVSPDGMTMTVVVPRLATTGKLTVIWPDGRKVDAPGTFTVDSYRDTNGFAFRNKADTIGLVEALDDETELFGYSETHVQIKTLITTITLPIPNAAALALDVAAQFIYPQGLCFGMDLTSQRLLHGDVSFNAFPLQQGQSAQTVWNLQGTGGPSDHLNHYIEVQHLAQFSDEVIGYYFQQINAGHTADDIYNQVVGAIQSNDRPIVSLTESLGKGHAVVAYNVRNVRRNQQNQVTDFDIDVYDPNRQFKTNENTDTSGVTHQQREDGSVIHISGGSSWAFTMDSNENWQGGFGTLAVVPYSQIPVHPHLPGLGTVVNALATFLFSDAAQTTQVADGQRHSLLRPDGTFNGNPATRLAQAGLYPPFAGPSSPGGFLLGGTGSYTQTVHGSGTGNYTEALFGHHFVVSATAGALPGVDDRLTLSPQADSFGFHTGAASKPLTVQLTGQAADLLEHTATFETTSYGGQGSDNFAFDPSAETVTYTHRGTTTGYHAVLSGYATDGTPISFITPTLQIQSGDTVTFRPTDWHHLDTVVMTVVHAEGGRTVRVLGHSAESPVEAHGRAFRATAGVRFTGAVATFTDEGGRGEDGRGGRPSAPTGTPTSGPAGSLSDVRLFVALIDWGDGSAPTLGVVRKSGSTYVVEGTHTYEHEGSYRVHVTIRDDLGATGTATSSALVQARRHGTDDAGTDPEHGRAAGDSLFEDLSRDRSDEG